MAKRNLNGKHDSSPFGGIIDPITINRMHEAVNNIASIRRASGEGLIDPRRDIEDEAGYPRIIDVVPPETYQQLYERDSVASRVVEVLPKESWQVQPNIYESHDSEKETPFEADWNALNKNLRGEYSWYQDEEGAPVWEYLLRADILCGIGQYGTVLLGFDDGKPLNQPVTKSKGMQVNFLRVFQQTLCPVARWESDVKNRRYGQPLSYNITFNDPKNSAVGLGLGLNTNTAEVHWTRVIHVADNLTNGEVFGTERMRPMLNNILGLHRLYASSPEMFYKAAFYGKSWETHPQLGGDVDVDLDALRDMLEDGDNSLQRNYFTRGMSAKVLSGNVADPTNHINIQIEGICIKIPCPKRVFMGSERGELASSQDDQSWNDVLRARQKYHITPKIIVPLVDRLIHFGVLSEPKGYTVEWPDLTSQTAGEKATVLMNRTAAYGQYVQGGIENVIPPMDYMTKFDDMTEDEAQAILDSAAELIEEKQAEKDAMAQEQGFEKAPPDGFKHPDPEPEPGSPIKVKEGEKLVMPDGTPVTNQEVDDELETIANQYGLSDHEKEVLRAEYNASNGA